MVTERTVINPYVRQRVVRCCHISLQWTSEIAASGDRKSWFPGSNTAVNHHLTVLISVTSVNNLQDGGRNPVETSHNLDYTRAFGTENCTPKHPSRCIVSGLTYILNIGEIFY